MTPLAILQQIRCAMRGQLRRRPMRYALSVVSISIAVAMFVSMRITQGSLLATFDANILAMSGNADAVVHGDGNVNDALLAKIERIPGVLAAPLVQGASTVISTSGKGPDLTILTVLGVDPIRDPRVRSYDTDTPEAVALMLQDANVVAIPGTLAELLSVKVGGRIDLRRGSKKISFTVATILKPGGPADAMGGKIVFMPVHPAQRLLGRGELYDRIEVKLPATQSVDSLRGYLGDAYRVASARQRNPTLEYLYSQFQTIMACIAVIAATIGLFMVYNSMSVSVVERAREIGTLRALGATRTDVLLAVAGEAAILGLVGSIIGLVLGSLLADGALAQAGRSINLIIGTGQIRRGAPFDAWLLAPAIGVLSAVLGAIAPARVAAALSPIATMKPGELGRALHKTMLGWLAASVPLMAVCVMLVAHPKSNWGLTLTGISLGLCGVALAGPQIVQWCGGIVRRSALGRLTLPSFLALDNTVQFPTRTSLTVVAFGGSLALVVALAGTIGAMEHGVRQWMDDVFALDLTLQSNNLENSAYTVGTFPNEMLEQVRADPAAKMVYGVRTRMLHFEGDEVLLVACDYPTFERVRMGRGLPSNAASGRGDPVALVGGAISVSANFANIHHTRIGDVLQLPTRDGKKSFTVNAIETDYGWFRGCVFMDLSVYRRLWNDMEVSYIDISVKPGTDVNAFRKSLAKRFADRGTVFIYSDDEIKAFALKMLGDWFRLANVQMLLAVAIGGIGVANTLMISVISQSRQIGLLRAVGATTGQIRKMLVVEAVYLGILGGVSGCLLGLATTRYLVSPMAIKATGYDLPHWTPWGTMAAACVAAVVIALGASAFPVRSVRRLDVVAAIGYE